MIKWFIAALSIVLTCSSHAADKMTVLLVDGQNNHNWKMTTPILQHALESCGMFSVTVSTSPEKGADAAAWNAWKPEFSKYDAVLSNYNGQSWPEDVRKSFEDYVSGGGAFTCIHAADNSFRDWKEYNKMIAIGGWGGRTEVDGPYLYFKDGEFLRDESVGRGGSHGPKSPFVVTVRNADHPITKGMPTEWLHARDELYDSLRGPAENVTVLATAYSEKSKKHEPMMLCIDYGKGRVFHTPMGHDDVSMKCVGFYNTLQRGTEWAVTGKVSMPLSDNFPGKDAVVPVQ
jgi:type 1 glutamine amidotransferase